MKLVPSLAGCVIVGGCMNTGACVNTEGLCRLVAVWKLVVVWRTEDAHRPEPVWRSVDAWRTDSSCKTAICENSSSSVASRITYSASAKLTSWTPSWMMKQSALWWWSPLHRHSLSCGCLLRQGPKIILGIGRDSLGFLLRLRRRTLKKVVDEELVGMNGFFCEEIISPLQNQNPSLHLKKALV